MTSALQSPGLIDRAEKALAHTADALKQMSAALARAKDLAGLPGVALAQARVAERNQLIENLARKLESQPVIEEAKGILMARSHCTPDEAFDILRRASMRSNRKLRHVAVDIVETTVRKPVHP